LIVSGVPLFAAPDVAAPAPPVVLAADSGSSGNSNPVTGTDTIIVRVSAGVADPAKTATAAVREASGVGVKSARLIGEDTVSVTLDSRLSSAAAEKVAKAAAAHSDVEAADRSLTFEPASGTVQDWQWNLGTGYGVDAQAAWKTATGKGVVVGVIDTGIAPNSALPTTTKTTARVSGAQVSGKTLAGLGITVTTAHGGCSATANSAGDFSCSMSAQPANNEVIAVTATDEFARTSIEKVAIPATPAMNPSNGTKGITGTANPGATVALTYRRGGTTLGTQTVSANSSGTWSATPGAALADRDTVTAAATNSRGDTSYPETLSIDKLPPEPPVLRPSNGTRVRGTAEPGATITLTYHHGDTAIPETRTGTADNEGTWSVAISATLVDGDIIRAIATDPAGNASADGSVAVDAVAPNPPVIEPSNGTWVKGTAEPGSTVTLTYRRGGVTLGSETVAVDGAGNWLSIEHASLVDGDTVTATTMDASENASADATITIDQIAPGPPTIRPTNGRFIQGTAEPGATISLTYRHGAETTPETQVVPVHSDGGWSLTPSVRLPDGVVIAAVATDPSGNRSAEGTVTVDASAPNAPVIRPSKGEVIAGTAEPGAIIRLTYQHGETSKTQETTADSDGNWSVTPTIALVHGDTVTATATDAVDNTSAPATTTIDTVAPDPPVIRPSNDSLVAGTAEPGAKIALTYHHGGAETAEHAVITADSSGDWTVEPSITLVDGDTVTATATDDAGNISEPSEPVTIDTVAPGAPTIQPSNGTRIEGSAEAGATVTLTYRRGEDTIGSQTAAADDAGAWSVEPNVTLVHGDTVTATATDPSGNSSGPAGTTVDTDAPDGPSVDPSNGRIVHVSGVEADATPSLIEDDGDKVPGDWTDEGEGRWRFVPSDRLAESHPVWVIVTDPAGNTSVRVAVSVDTTAPTAPVIEPTQGGHVAGSRDADTIVTLTWTDADGEHERTLADVDYPTPTTWATTLNPAATDGTTIRATATDAVGNTSASGTTKADSTPPGAPELDPTNGETVSGTKEAGSFITLDWSDGSETHHQVYQPSATTTWRVTLAPPATPGSTVTATATDPAGNVSAEGTAGVDTTAPEKPQVNPTNGRIISGTAEPRARITISYTSGESNLTRSTTVTQDGSWSKELNPAADSGSEITVTATDAAGNASGAQTVSVDADAPSVPSVSPTRGHTVIVSGVEAGATPSLVDRDGVTVACDWTHNEDGSWTGTPGRALDTGDDVWVIVTDTAGNRSEPATVVIDKMPPDAPAITAVSTTAVSGTAEPGSSVTVSYGTGGSRHTTPPSVAGNGSWTVVLDPNASPGDEVTAVATDLAGNESEPAATQTVPEEPSQPSEPETEPSEQDSQTGSGSESTESSGDVQARPASVQSKAASVRARSGSSSSSAPSAGTSTQAAGAQAASDSSGTAITTTTAAAAGAAQAGESDTTVQNTTNATNVVGTVLPGYDFIQNDADPTDADPTITSSTDTSQYHGTHVAGIVAGTGSGFWPAGVAPAVQIEPLRVLYAHPSSTYQNSMDRIIEAINWGAGTTVKGLPANPNPVDVLNLSIQTQGATSCPSTLQAAIDAAVAKGVVVVAAAGNYNSSITTSAPANCKNVIVVTASTASGERASGSNWGTSATGSTWLVAAPGGSGSLTGCGAYNTLTSCTGAVVSTVANSIQAKSGTSMAAPHVAGVAALLKQANSKLSPLQIANIIRGTAKDMTDGCPTAGCGSGIVDAAAAVEKAQTTISPKTGPSASVRTLTVKSGTAVAKSPARVGTVLKATATASYSTPTYQWLRDGTAISGATSTSYTLVSADYGRSISVRATPIGGTSRDSAKVKVSAKGALKSTVRPAAAGTYKVKKTLTATLGTWTPEQPAKATYQWYRGSKKIKKATKATYKLTTSDRGKMIKVKVTVEPTGYYPASAYSVSHKIKR
jgi:subtilisin family serine protease